MTENITPPLRRNPWLSFVFGGGNVSCLL